MTTAEKIKTPSLPKPTIKDTYAQIYRQNLDALLAAAGNQTIDENLRLRLSREAQNLTDWFLG